MAGKGSEAKTNLMNKFIEALGSDYLGVEDGKKWYFNSTEAGQKVQVCVTLTCPKVPFEGNAPAVASGDAADSPSNVVTELSDEDRRKIEELKERLNIASNCPF